MLAISTANVDGKRPMMTEVPPEEASVLNTGGTAIVADRIYEPYTKLKRSLLSRIEAASGGPA
jgi:hypothetical protein